MKKPTGSIDPTAVNTKVGVLITPEQIAKSGTEHGHQAAFFQWIAIHGSKGMDSTDMLFAIPNGGDRQASVAAGLKAEGIKAGVPDVFWPVCKFYDRQELAMQFAGLWIELKTPKHVTSKNGGRSDAQVAWAKKLREQGYAVVLAFGWQAMAWAVYLYQNRELKMPDGDDALFALPVEQPPVVERKD